MNPRPPVGWLLTAVLLVLVLPLGAGAQTMAFDRGARASISGRIVLAPEKFPAQHVEVMLTPVTGGLPSMAFTDSDGGFQFLGLHEGTYVVAVREPGYEAVQVTVRVNGGPEAGLMLSLTKRDATPPGQNGDTVSVRELSIPAKARKEFQKGIERIEKKDPAGSLPHFQRAIEIFPSYYEAYLQVGFAHNSLGQSDEAEKAIRRSVELSGEGFADADFALSELLAQHEQFGDAEKVARHGLELKPASWVGQFLLGQALFGLNRLKEAEQSARKVLSLKRDLATVHLLLANIHLRTHDNVSLLDDLNAYLTLDPNGSASAQARQMRETVQQSLAAAAPAANQ